MSTDPQTIPLSQARRRIHAAAMKLFAERGVTKVTISELASAAGMARGTIYSHVPDVDSLFEDVAAQLAREMIERVVAGFAGLADPPQRLAIGVRQYIRRAHEEPLWGRFMSRFGMSPALTQALHGTDPIADFEAGIASGRYRVAPDQLTAMVGLLADLNAPDLFDAHVMVAPSPCYLNLPGYRGGFDLPDLQASLNLMDVNLPVWVNAMAPGLMGGPHGDPLTQELAASLHRTAAAPLRQFAHVTFMGDYRQRLTELVKPVAVLQASDDTIAPQDVGRFMHRKLPDCSLNVVPCSGHFPQLRNAGACIAAMGKFLSGLGLAGGMASAIR